MRISPRVYLAPRNLNQPSRFESLILTIVLLYLMYHTHIDDINVNVPDFKTSVLSFTVPCPLTQKSGMTELIVCTVL